MDTNRIKGLLLGVLFVGVCAIGSGEARAQGTPDQVKIWDLGPGQLAYQMGVEADGTIVVAGGILVPRSVGDPIWTSRIHIIPPNADTPTSSDLIPPGVTGNTLGWAASRNGRYVSVQVASGSDDPETDGIAQVLDRSTNTWRTVDYLRDAFGQPLGYAGSIGDGISDNGIVAVDYGSRVGFFNLATQQATVVNGLRPEGLFNAVSVFAISADGTTMVGHANPDDHILSPVYWTSSNPNPTPLYDPFPLHGGVFGISPSRRYMVGHTADENTGVAALWDANNPATVSRLTSTDPAVFTTPQGKVQGFLLDVSDSNIAVGSAGPGLGRVAIVKPAGPGLEAMSLQRYLQQGWNFNLPSALAAARVQHVLDIGNYLYFLVVKLPTTFSRGDSYIIRIRKASVSASLCDGKVVTIIGSEGPSATINGTSGGDVIMARADNNIVNGNAGSDTVCVERGNSLVNGGNDDDTVVIKGSGSLHIVNGGNGSDIIDASQATGATLFNGGRGDDTIRGGSGFNTILGGSGTDSCTRRPGDVVTRCEITIP